MRTPRTMAEIGFGFGLLFAFACYHFVPDMKVWAWLVLPAFFAVAFPTFFSDGWRDR